jgi:hypothetical protein
MIAALRLVYEHVFDMVRQGCDEQLAVRRLRNVKLAGVEGGPHYQLRAARLEAPCGVAHGGGDPCVLGHPYVEHPE